MKYVCVCRCVGIYGHVLRAWLPLAVQSWADLAPEERVSLSLSLCGWNVCDQRHPSLEHNAVQSGVLTRSLRRSTYSGSDCSALGASKASVLHCCVIYTHTTASFYFPLWPHLTRLISSLVVVTDQLLCCDSWTSSYSILTAAVFMRLCYKPYNCAAVSVSAWCNSILVLLPGLHCCFISVVSCHNSRHGDLKLLLT